MHNKETQNNIQQHLREWRNFENGGNCGWVTLTCSSGCAIAILVNGRGLKSCIAHTEKYQPLSLAQP